MLVLCRSLIHVYEVWGYWKLTFSRYTHSLIKKKVFLKQFNIFFSGKTEQNIDYSCGDGLHHTDYCPSDIQFNTTYHILMCIVEGFYREIAIQVFSRTYIFI